MANRHDWQTIRAHYVEGGTEGPDADPSKRVWPTLDDLALLYGVHPSTIYKRSAREHWPDQREQHQAQIDRERREALVRERGQRAASIDQRALSASEAGLALVGHRLGFVMAAQAQLEQGHRGAGIDAREQSSLALAAWRWVRVKDAVLGTPTAGEEPTLDEMEREQRVEETMLAATLAARAAAREQDEATLADG